MGHLKQELDEHLARFESRLPAAFQAFVRWLRKPGSGWTRIPLGIILILCGFIGFLPILGFWMVPLGFLILAIDVPFVRPPLIRLLDWVELKWPAPKAPPVP